MLTSTQREEIGLTFVLSQLTCFSPYGIEKARNYSNFTSFRTLYETEQNLEKTFDNIEILKAQPRQIKDELSFLLSHFKNIRNTVKRCESVTLGEVELFEVKGFLLMLEKLLLFIENTGIALLGLPLVPMNEALEILDPSGNRHAPFSLEAAFSEKLAKIRKDKLKIETKPITGELETARNELIYSEHAEEQAVLEDLTKKLRPFIPDFVSNMDNIGELDVLLAKALLAEKFNAVRPLILSKKEQLIITNMFNPYTAQAVRSFTPVSLDIKKPAAVITGANMGGKSVTVKTILLNTMLCNMGFFVFAESAQIPFFDDVFFVAENSGTNFLSSFGAEMQAIKEILSRKDFLLIILDEPARSTNPSEGKEIVQALVSHLSKTKNISVITTHFDDVIPEEAEHYQTAGITPNFLQYIKTGGSIKDSGEFIDYSLHKVKRNTPVPKDAINICRLIGLGDIL